MDPKPDTRTRAHKRRAMLQETERDHLRNMGLIQYAIECIDKMREAEDAFTLAKWDKIADKYLSLSKRYLGEVKQVDIDAYVDHGRSLSELSSAELLALRRELGAADEDEREGESPSVH